ncbi:Uma2 family endonuclease [Romeria aff. gracilis LEGE 07310]|uniref:Uma2 family endonuclease n=1 Tax=Vasconcelosia minhoensis LEGE 07310 TaxID=915328 RepID=A0A8J7AZB7_9CYAN|nr:Uma2 family endonuclease [Romeria aff. gracilis LEGE 07310]
MALLTRPLTLQAFLRLPNIEESPAWELIHGQPLQKPMPALHHSRLQKRLVAAIEQVDSPFCPKLHSG